MPKTAGKMEDTRSRRVKKESNTMAVASRKRDEPTDEKRKMRDFTLTTSPKCRKCTRRVGSGLYTWRVQCERR